MVKNKTILVVITLLLGMALTAAAENYPYRSDVLWVTVPNHADWLYRTGEKATVEVQFYKYGIPQDGVTVNYELGNDMMPSDTKGSVILKKRQGRRYYWYHEAARVPGLPSASHDWRKDL